MDYVDIDDRPWWRRGRGMAAAAAVLGVLAMAVLFTVQPWDDTPAGGESRQEGARAETDADTEASSRCGLPDGDQSIPTTALAADWRVIDRAVVPISPNRYGPADETMGIYTCYARNPGGALTAAALDAAQRGSRTVDASEYVEARYAKGANYEQGLAALEALEAQPDDNLSAEIAGFRVLSYTPAEARLEIVLRLTESQFAGQLLASYYELTWVDGDWQLIMPADFDATVRAIDTLAGYVEWSPGAADPAPGGEGLPRSAPAWGLRGAAPALAIVRPVTALAEDYVLLAQEILTRVDTAEQEEKRSCSGLRAFGCAADVVKSGPAIGKAVVGAAPGAAVGAVASSAAGSAFETMALSMTEAEEWAMKTLLTAWLKYPDPDLQGSDSSMVWLQGKLQVFVAFVVVGAVLLAAYRLATTGRFEHLGELGMVLGRVILTGGLVGFVVTLGLEIGDLFSEWILDQVDFEFDGIFTLDAESPAWILLIAGGFVVLVQLFQFAIMIFRYGAILYLAAGVTLFAAASNTRVGKQGWEKSLAWLLAFVFYKPVAALIYAMAIRLTNADRTGADQIAGIAMTALALVALPALMRLIAPHTAALGGANAGVLAGATVGAAVATGAVVATAGGAAAGGSAGGAGFAGLGGGTAGGASTATVTGAGAGGGGGGGGGASGGGGGSSSPTGTPPASGGQGEASPGGQSVTGASSQGGESREGSGLGSTVDDGSAGSPGRAPSGAPGGASGGSASAGDLLRGAHGGSASGRRVGGAAGVADGADEEDDT